MLALVNVATMLCTPVAGRQVDRRGPDRVNLVCMLAVLAAAGVLAFGGLGGVPGFAALVVGTLLLDVGMQSGMVANQVRIYGLDRDVFSRLNTAYMTCAYLGGSLGSWVGVRAYTSFGWSGVCVLLALLTTAALVRHLAADKGKVADDRVVAEVGEAGPVGEVGRLDRATGPVGPAAIGSTGE
jgi:predicted MFS family arabinose efflux permease